MDEGRCGCGAGAFGGLMKEALQMRRLPYTEQKVRRRVRDTLARLSLAGHTFRVAAKIIIIALPQLIAAEATGAGARGPRQTAGTASGRSRRTAPGAFQLLPARLLRRQPGNAINESALTS